MRLAGQKILPQDDDTGQRVIDKLVKVFLLDGSEKWLLIHIEIQGYREVDFAKRVYNCNYRISDRFGEKVISVALLTDDDPAFRENVYEISQMKNATFSAKLNLWPQRTSGVSIL